VKRKKKVMFDEKMGKVAKGEKKRKKKEKKEKEKEKEKNRKEKCSFIFLRFYVDGA
jgi:hypothetical protein